MTDDEMPHPGDLESVPEDDPLWEKECFDPFEDTDEAVRNSSDEPRTDGGCLDQSAYEDEWQSIAAKAVESVELPEGWEASIKPLGSGVAFDCPRPDSWDRHAAPGVDLVLTAPDFQSVLTVCPGVSTHYADTECFEDAIAKTNEAIETIHQTLHTEVGR